MRGLKEDIKKRKGINIKKKGLHMNFLLLKEWDM